MIQVEMEGLLDEANGADRPPEGEWDPNDTPSRAKSFEQVIEIIRKAGVHPSRIVRYNLTAVAMRLYTCCDIVDVEKFWDWDYEGPALRSSSPLSSSECWICWFGCV